MRRLGLLLFVMFAALAGWSVLGADPAAAEDAPQWPAPGLTLPTEAPIPLVETPPTPDPPVAPEAPPAPAPVDVPVPPAPAPVIEQLPGTGAGRRVVYSNSRQRVWWVEGDGRVVRSYAVSGRRGTPRPGTYSVFSRSRVSYSGSVRLDYMVRFARGRSLPIGFHAIPVGRRGPIQSLGELGQFRSHGCVRQAPSDAAALWEWAQLGTRVVVTA